jgi:hypothetical protein
MKNNTARTQFEMKQVSRGIRKALCFLMSVATCLSLGLQVASAQTDANGRTTDFKNPIRDANAPDGNQHWHVTICNDGGQYVFSKSNTPVEGTPNFMREPPLVSGDQRYAADGGPDGTDNSFHLSPHHVGDANFKITSSTGKTIHLTVHVEECINVGADSNLHHRGVASAISPIAEGGLDGSQDVEN